MKVGWHVENVSTADSWLLPLYDWVLFSPILKSLAFSPALYLPFMEIPGEKYQAGLRRASWETGSAFLNRHRSKSTSRQNRPVG